MSAFMVGNESINRLVDWFAGLQHINHGVASYVRHYQPFAFTGDEANQREQERDVGQQMHDLNAKAVFTRYEGRHGSDNPPPFVRTFGNGHLSGWQALKSLDCFLYQCSEGDIPKTSMLYLQLDAFRGHLARALATSTKEYEACKWA